jgi:hypothetical protein
MPFSFTRKSSLFIKALFIGCYFIFSQPVTEAQPGITGVYQFSVEGMSKKVLKQ